MLLRHVTTKDKIPLILTDGYLKSTTTNKKERGRVYFEEYKGNDFLIDFINNSEGKKHLTKDDFVSLIFDSEVLEQNRIEITLSTDQTKSETLVLIGTLYSAEQQEQIGDYYYVLNQTIPIELCTTETQQLLTTFEEKFQK